MNDKNGIIAWAFFLLLFLTGCPYDSEVPLGDASQSMVDSALIGSWRFPGRDTMYVMNFNGHEYYIELHEHDRTTGRQILTRFRGFSTPIGSRKFMNISEMGKPERYNFFTYEILGSRLTMAFVSDSCSKQRYATPLELAGFVEKNMEQDCFFDAPDTVFRVNN